MNQIATIRVPYIIDAFLGRYDTGGCRFFRVRRNGLCAELCAELGPWHLAVTLGRWTPLS